jgi:anti-sigma factor (TIGR02949 family)
MGTSFDLDPCAACEEVLQPFLDRQLSEAERIEAQRHLDACPFCAKRFRFEESLREVVRVASFEEMAPDLKQRLQALRTPLL